MSTINELRGAQIAVLEDEADLLQELVVRLHAGGIMKCRSAADYKAFKIIVRNTRIYAASIDWNINGVDKGPETLELLRATQPWAARVVYTRYDNREADARMFHADFFLFKQSGNEAEFKELMLKGAKLGLTRFIHHYLTKKGETGLPELPISGPVSEIDEEQIFTIARQITEQHQSGETQDAELLDLMVQRGWWRDIKDENDDHLSTSELNDYIKHKLNALGHEIVKAHLDQCVACKAAAFDLLSKGPPGRRAFRDLSRNRIDPDVSKKITTRKPPILATYKGWVDRVFEGVAYLTLVDNKERTVTAKYNAGLLEQEGIRVGSYFQCMLVGAEPGESGSRAYVEFKLDKEPPPDPDAARKSLKELEDKYREFSLTDDE